MACVTKQWPHHSNKNVVNASRTAPRGTIGQIAPPKSRIASLEPLLRSG